MLSICIPTLNRAELLRKNFEHLLTFKELDFEVNVSNNGSSDHTQDVIEEYRKKFPKFNSNTFKSTIGRVENWDTVIRMATQKYVFALADDDNSLEQGLLETLHLLESNDDIGAVYGGLKEFTLDEEFITDNKKCEQVEVYDHSMRLALLGKYWSFEVPVFRRTVYEQSSPVHANSGALSWLFLSEVFKAGHRVAVSPSFLFKHYVHKDRVTEQMAADPHLNFVLVSEVEMYLGDTTASPQEKFTALFNYKSQLYNFQAHVCLRNFDFIQARFFIQKGFLYNPEHFGALVLNWDRSYLLPAAFQEIRARVGVVEDRRRVIILTTNDSEKKFLSDNLNEMSLTFASSVSEVQNDAAYDPQTDVVISYHEQSLDELGSNHNVMEFRTILNSLKFTQNNIEVSLDE